MNNLTIRIWSFYSEFSENNYMLHYKSSVIYQDVFWGQNQLKKKCEVTTAIIIKILQFKVPRFLDLQKYPIIKPNNWNLSNHIKWKKNFTWFSDFRDNKYRVIRQHLRKTPKNWWNRKIPKKLSIIILTIKSEILVNKFSKSNNLVTKNIFCRLYKTIH